MIEIKAIIENEDDIGVTSSMGGKQMRKRKKRGDDEGGENLA